MYNKLKNIGLDWFILAISFMVILAYYLPQLGIAQKPISLATITKFGISGIFFFYGLKLNPKKLIQGLSNWRLHIIVQSITFLLFPLIILSVKCFFMPDSSLWLGLFFLSTLPSTVSSSVVMVSIAGGNIPAAIFNASISAFIGIVVTPLWLGLFLTKQLLHFEVSAVVLKLSLQVLLPLIAGIFLHKKVGFIAERHKESLKIFDQLVILLIIYTSFSKSFSDHIFNELSFSELTCLILGLMLLFLCVLVFCKFIAKSLRFNAADTITLLFCGSKKSLVHGTVMIGILFSESSITGYILLPIMIYHALQLMTTSVLAKRMSHNL